MYFNVCIVYPPNYIHVFAFLEIAESIHFALLELGHQSSLQFRKIEKDAVNIVFGCHLLEPELIHKIPKNTIFVNTEQIHNLENDWVKTLILWARQYEIWDYSERNIIILNRLDIFTVKHLKLGFQKELVRIKKSLSPDIDILFYGSINERRSKIIDNLNLLGLNVRTLFGVYGEKRDELIARSKIVLNLHFYDSQIFEIVRVFYLLTNSIAVVGEVNNSTSIDDTFRAAICSAPYEQIVETCQKVIKDDSIRNQISSNGFKLFSKYPQSEYIKFLI
jgi:hypothetical protein